MPLIISCKENGQNTQALTNNDDSEEVVSNLENRLTFSGNYDDLLTLERASRITGFEPSKARKTHTLNGMTSEILRYNWKNGLEPL